MVETTYSSGLIELSVYDALGREIYATDPYDPKSGVLPDGIHTVYDALGRVVETQQLTGLLIDITTTPAGNSYTTFVSDTGVIGTTTTVYGGNGQVQFDHRRLRGDDHLPVRQPRPRDRQHRRRGGQDELHLRPVRQPPTVTDPLGNTTKYQYDSFGNLVLTTLPDGTTIKDSYDSQGNLTEETDQLGNTTDYVYNAQGELTSEILPAVPDPNHGGASPGRPTPTPTTLSAICSRSRTRTAT